MDLFVYISLKIFTLLNALHVKYYTNFIDTTLYISAMFICFSDVCSSIILTCQLTSFENFHSHYFNRGSLNAAVAAERGRSRLVKRNRE